MWKVAGLGQRGPARRGSGGAERHIVSVSGCRAVQVS